MTIVQVKPARGDDNIIHETYKNAMRSSAKDDRRQKSRCNMSHENESESQLENINDNHTTTKSDSTMSSLWTDFRENTTMHGVRNLRMGYKYRVRWLIWMMAWLVMGSLLIFNMYKLYSYYSTNPTLTKIEVNYMKEMVFPAITICNLSPYKKSGMNMSHAMETFMLHVSRFGWVLPPLNFSDPAFAELNKSPDKDWFNKSTFSMDDLFLFCKKRWNLEDCRQMLTETITGMGKCFTYNSLNKTKEKGRVKESITGTSTALGFYIDVKQDEYVYDFSLAAGIKVILHEPDEEPDVINKGFIVTPGWVTYVSMKMTQYKYLPPPYKAGGDRYCVDTKAPGYVNPLKYYPEYSRSACLLECRRDYIVGECGCRAITDRGDERFCTFVEVATCYRQYEANFDALSGRKEQCNCQISCKYTEYDYSLSSAFIADISLLPLAQLGITNMEKDKIEVQFYYDTLSFLSVESIPEYNSEDIIGIFGGQMGIFLGASLLTLSEFLEFIILSFVVFVKSVLSRI